MRVLLFLVLFFYSFLEAAQNGISGDSLIEWINGNSPVEFLIVDLRDTSSVRSTGAIGKDSSCSAYNIPFTLINDNTIDSLLKIFPEDTAVVFYCFSEHVSKTVAEDLSKFDERLKRLFYLEKGFRAWNGPIVSNDEVKPKEAFPDPFCSKTSVEFLSITKIKTMKEKDNSVFDLHGRICINKKDKIQGIQIINKKIILNLKNR